MTEDDIRALDHPHEGKPRARAGDSFVNIIYKMMRDGYRDEIIYQYIQAKVEVKISKNTIWDYIRAISLENFPNRKRTSKLFLKKSGYEPDVIVLKRTDILKYILTTNSKTEKDGIIGENIEIIKNKYPIVTWIEKAFHEFHELIMGKDTSRLDEYIKRYSSSKISSFCDGIKKDIAPVRNAISYDVSSGFVEGNNNKFKLIKRIVYGRAKLINLTKKCMLAFSIKKEDFNLLDLI